MNSQVFSPPPLHKSHPHPPLPGGCLPETRTYEPRFHNARGRLFPDPLLQSRVPIRPGRFELPQARSGSSGGVRPEVSESAPPFPQIPPQYTPPPEGARKRRRIRRSPGGPTRRERAGGIGLPRPLVALQGALPVTGTGEGGAGARGSGGGAGTGSSHVMRGSRGRLIPEPRRLLPARGGHSRAPGARVSPQAAGSDAPGPERRGRRSAHPPRTPLQRRASVRGANSALSPAWRGHVVPHCPSCWTRRKGGRRWVCAGKGARGAASESRLRVSSAAAQGAHSSAQTRLPTAPWHTPRKEALLPKAFLGPTSR